MNMNYSRNAIIIPSPPNMLTSDIASMTTKEVAPDVLIPPAQWVRASTRSRCAVCTANFSAIRLKHHCRMCGDVVCVMCYAQWTTNLPVVGRRRVKICTTCITTKTLSPSSSSSAVVESSSSSSDSASSKSAASASKRSLAKRKVHNILEAMTPIKQPQPSSVDTTEVIPHRPTTSTNNGDHRPEPRPWNVDEQSLQVQWRDGTELCDEDVIGCGGHGIVWLVRHKTSAMYFASKRLLDPDSDDGIRDTFLEEIRLASTLRHPRIVTFIGVAWTPRHELQAIFEFMPQGDIRRFMKSQAPLNETTSAFVAHPQRLQIAIDVIDALAYLHSFVPPLVHRDIKSKNVLLDEDLRAKLTDFGVSRFQSNEGTMTTGVGTGRWLAPEVMNGGGTYDCACDVYSFGMLLSELDTNRPLFSDLQSIDGQPIPEVRLMLLISLGKAIPSFTETCPPQILNIARDCVQFDPSRRPTAEQVASRLRQAQTALTS